MRYFLCDVLLLLAGTLMSGQSLKIRPAEPPQAAATPPLPKEAPSIPLTVPAGTPLKVVLDQEIRIQKVGQKVHGKTAEPIYAFDQLLVPAGSEVNGRVAEIGPVLKRTRAVAALNADFSPDRKVRIEFDELVLKDGRHLPIHVLVTPGSSAVLRFVPASEKPQGKVAEGKEAAKGKVSQARQQIHDQIAGVKEQIHAPNKMHRLERLALAQSPYHPQYVDSGTTFIADVQEPLSFGSEQLKAETLTSIGAQPPSGSLVHAWLTTPLSSATSKKGELVDAVISQPLVVSDHLFLPEGSHLKGTVLEVMPARRLGRNGQLRITFHQVVPPSGIEQEIEATLEGVDVNKGQNLKLDSEGGAQVTTPKTRYLTTGIAVMLAASSAAPDGDRGLHHGTDGGGDAGGGAANGASGFKLVGMLVGAFAHSRVVATGFGSYGAAMSVYSHFLARGRDVVYPKDMSMVLDLGTRKEQANPARAAHVPAEPSPQPSKNASSVIPAQSRPVS
jgi:hypothetical protein